MILAYRSWRLREDGMLAGYWDGSVWGKGAEQASCPLCGAEDHKVPKKTCSCGYYAFRKPTLYSIRDPHGVIILGSVLLWGKIVEHTEGYRAEFAKIEALFYPHHLEPTTQLVSVDYYSHMTYIGIGRDHQVCLQPILDTVESNYGKSFLPERIKFKRREWCEHYLFGQIVL